MRTRQSKREVQKIKLAWDMDIPLLRIAEDFFPFFFFFFDPSFLLWWSEKSRSSNSFFSMSWNWWLRCVLFCVSNIAPSSLAEVGNQRDNKRKVMRKAHNMHLVCVIPATLFCKHVIIYYNNLILLYNAFKVWHDH